MPSLTNTNAANGAPTSTDGENNPPTNPQDAARPRLTLHLNAKQRKEAEAAAQSLRQAQAALERHRKNLNGRAARHRRITRPLVDSASAAITRFNRIMHPGGRAREMFDAALRDWGETLRIMVDVAQRELDVGDWLQGADETMRGGEGELEEPL